jgi:hypothetical protein
MGCENSKAVKIQPVGPARGDSSRDNTKRVAGKEGATQTPEAKKKHSGKGSRGKTHDSASSHNHVTEYDLDEQGNKVARHRSAASSGKRRNRRPVSPNTKDLMGSCESLDDARSLGSDRGFSATSKQSADSGLGEEYAHVITEFSEQGKIKEVESTFKPRDDLGE